MNQRECMLAAYNFREPERIPIEYYNAPVGLYEHGEKLNELYHANPGNFSADIRSTIPVLGPECFDENGRYHEFRRDAWGTVWEYRIYGIAGIESEYPLDDWAKYDEYVFPDLPDWAVDSAAFERFKADVKKHKETHFYRIGGGSLFERIIALRPFEDILCDLYNDDGHLIDLMDRLVEYYEPQIDAMIRAGVDAIQFGDDFGTEQDLIFSPEIFRTHFKPRYERLMKPIREAGIKINFHSCGKISKLLPEFYDLGVNGLWPQLPAYDMQWLADTLRDMRIALCIHTDRANVMTYGTPDDVRALVRKEYEIFRPDKGGSWFYVEADNGMPFENIRALVETIARLR